MRNHHRNRHGLTLIELLLTVAVLTSVTVFILTALGQARITRTHAAESLALLKVAQTDLDTQRAVHRLHPLSTGETTASVLLDSLRSRPSALLTRSVTSMSTPGLALLNVVASFPDHPEGLKPVELATVIATSLPDKVQRP